MTGITLPSGWGFPRNTRLGDDVPADRSNNLYRSQCAQIAFWLGRLRYVPDVAEIRARWGVSRATAYRWHNFAENGGMVPPGPLHHED